MPKEKKKGRFQKAKREQTLTITSLMDMMTIILVYLLKSFAAEGQILTSADNLVLPNSTSKTNPKEVSLQMAISPDWIMVDNIPIIRTNEGLVLAFKIKSFSVCTDPGIANRQKHSAVREVSGGLPELKSGLLDIAGRYLMAQVDQFGSRSNLADNALHDSHIGVFITEIS